MNGLNSALFELVRYELLSSPVDEALKQKLIQDGEYLSRLMKLARKHDLVHLAAEALISEGIIDEAHPLFKRTSQMLVMAVYRYEQLEYVREKVYECFEKNGIDYIPLKGSVTRSFYPKPWMRTSCDADILVKKEQLDKAVSLLKDELSGKPDWSSAHDVPIEFENDVHIELHFTLREKWYKATEKLENVWEYAYLCDGTKHRYLLKDEMFYFYHILHMAKHMKIGGCGVKPFIDMWLINKNYPETEERKRLLELGGLKKFELSARKLSEAWMTGEEDETLASFESFVLSGGVYGHSNKTSPKSVSEEIIRPDRIFLSPTELKYKYKALEKHIWLYPFFAVARIFRLVFRTLPLSVIRRIKNTDGEASLENQKMFKDIGL